ncbi:MAG: polyprenyl synthetase family protein [Paludibacteraceae bacterium]|jgi:octaprenyl-diphosphate synthase|nr:polyprenyl synthetase family protein [Paludibacteraceae bacterium]
MVTIEEVKSPIVDELVIFNTKFDAALDTENKLLNVVHQHVKNNKGKQIRPTLTLLSAKICGNINENTYKTALSLELLHTASLIHDDIVDNSSLRRGQSSVNAIWDNHISVLVGDYLLSQSLQIAAQADNLAVIDLITHLGKQLAEGELLQIGNAQKISINEENYLEVIRKKTAMLFTVCTTCGAVTALDCHDKLSDQMLDEDKQRKAGKTIEQETDRQKQKIAMMRHFGELYGMSFQIRDDIFDYIADEKKIGKPVGNDIREGKVTLPLIYAYNHSTESEQKVVMEILKQKDFSEENVGELINFAIKKGGIEYAQKRMEDFSKEAEKQLETFEESDAKTALQQLICYSTQRKK